MPNTQRELKGMADRINGMRVRLFEELQRVGAPGRWNHIVEQIGMFSYTGLTKARGGPCCSVCYPPAFSCFWLSVKAGREQSMGAAACMASLALMAEARIAVGCGACTAVQAVRQPLLRCKCWLLGSYSSIEMVLSGGAARSRKWST